jgi:drug/metabolite transporter (DMT)-like permease
MSRRAGYAAAALAAVLWAAGGAAARHVIDQGASLVELTEARAWIAALVLVGLLLARPSEPRHTDRVSRVLVVVFGLSIAGANFTYYASLSRLPVAVAITIQYTAPGLVVAWTVVSSSYRPSRALIAAFALAVGGVALLAELPTVAARGHVHLSIAGIGFAVASAFAFATYMITGQRLGRTIGARRAVAHGFVVASVLWVIVQAARGRPHTLLQTRFVPWVLFLAVATTIIPFLAFVWGLERVPASSAGIVSTLEPLTAALIAYVWLGQALSVWQLTGAGLVLVGIAIVQLERPASDDVLVERAAVGE